MYFELFHLKNLLGLLVIRLKKYAGKFNQLFNVHIHNYKLC